MKYQVKIAFLMLFIMSVNSFSQNRLRSIYEVDIIKATKVNGKPKFVRIFIDSEGIISQGDIEKGTINKKSFEKAINNFTQKEENVIKVDGDNDERTGMQEPHNGQNFYVSIIYQDDYDKESHLINKTSYRYREAQLPLDYNDYKFLKYFTESDSKKIKELLQ